MKSILIFIRVRTVGGNQILRRKLIAKNASTSVILMYLFDTKIVSKTVDVCAIKRSSPFFCKNYLKTFEEYLFLKCLKVIRWGGFLLRESSQPLNRSILNILKPA